MKASIKKEIKAIGGEKIRFDVPMSQYTTLKTGGKAEILYRAGDLKKLKEILNFLVNESIPYLIVGKGSNLLVMDGGLDKAVVILEGSFSLIEYPAAGATGIFVGAGVSLSRLVDFCSIKGLAGVEFLAGIPGTVGGAIFMNAGSWGKEIKDVVDELTILTKNMIIERKSATSIKFWYRGVSLNEGDIILNAKLRLSFDKPDSIKERVVSNIKKRKEKFPVDMPSAGSIFKNPESDYAGRLIEAAGLKGKSIGGAMISPKHANFIVKKGQCSASDISELMDLAISKVKQMYDVQLLPEIKVVGKK